jgi:DNA-nicking Smr family endonuclease
MTRRRRTPTEEELALWEKVTDSVAPLATPPPKSLEAKPVAAKPAPAKSPPPPRPKATKPAPPAAVPPPAPAKPKAPPLHTLDRRTRGRLSRGNITIDRRVDLHGLTQAAAHVRLGRFLRDAQDEGAKIVLVITGKGKPPGMGGGEIGGEERGILRRMVPTWLAAPDMRAVVIGFDEAGPGHGGAGALYVRLRRVGRG